MSSHSVKLAKALRDLERIKNAFGYVANTNPDAYSIGLFNGIECAMSIMQDREPKLKGKDSDQLLNFLSKDSKV